MHGLYKLFYNMYCNSNKQTNNQLTSINEKFHMKIFCKTFMNVFHIIKKCYKLACIDYVKTCAIAPFQYSIKT
jgi:hypothetical protein